MHVVPDFAKAQLRYACDRVPDGITSLLQLLGIVGQRLVLPSIVKDCISCTQNSWSVHCGWDEQQCASSAACAEHGTT